MKIRIKNKKLFMSLMVVLSLLLLVLASDGWSQKDAEAFSDVNANHWANAEISYLTDQAIIKGYPDGTFKPNNDVTRLQAVQMIIRSQDINTSHPIQPDLVDVNPLTYGYEYIAKAVELGIIHGKTNAHGERYFDASGQLTRAQMAKILSLAYELEGDSTFTFPDVPKGHWAYAHVQTLIDNGITSGYANGNYGPHDPMTRTQFSVMMARILNDGFKVEGPTKPEPTPEPAPAPEPTPEPEEAPDTSAEGKTYPDGWTAPVLESSWSPDYSKNYDTLETELGFTSYGGSGFSIPEYPNVIQVISHGGQDVNINFYGWENPRTMPKTSYRIPIVAKELFKLYFGNDANRVFNYFETGDAPETFTANGFHAKIVQGDGVTVLQLTKQ